MPNAHSLGIAQREVINVAQSIIESLQQDRVSHGYITTWAPTPGYSQLRDELGLPAHRRRGAAIRELMTLATVFGVVNCGGADARLRGLHLLTYCNRNDFRDGRFIDAYTSISPDGHRVSAIAVSTDGFIPSVPIPGLTMVVPARRFGNQFGREYSFRSITEAVGQIVSDRAAAQQFSGLFISYEAQPFQHAAVLALSRVDQSIPTWGYLHSALPPVPTDLLYRFGAPKTLLVHGGEQARIAQEVLGWPADSVQVVQRLRRTQLGEIRQSRRIYLPYWCRNVAAIVSSLEALLDSESHRMPIEIMPHPRQCNRATRQLERGIRKVVERRSLDSAGGGGTLPPDIFIGATAAVLDRLETFGEALHICSDPLFESYQEEIWGTVAVSQVLPQIFHYRLLVPRSLISGPEAEDLRPMFLGSNSA
jgi:hypothetical protein